MTHQHEGVVRLKLARALLTRPRVRAVSTQIEAVRCCRDDCVRLFWIHGKVQDLRKPGRDGCLRGPGRTEIHAERETSFRGAGKSAVDPTRMRRIEGGYGWASHSRRVQSHKGRAEI